MNYEKGNNLTLLLKNFKSLKQFNTSLKKFQKFKNLLHNDKLLNIYIQHYPNNYIHNPSNYNNY